MKLVCPRPKQLKAIIMGAAGRDFHNFNIFFRENCNYKVVAFTAAQIPDISGRKYPKQLAGKYYPKGIPIYGENDLPKLIKKFNVDYVFLSYSDLNHVEVMHKASIAMANGANFVLFGPRDTSLDSKVPVIAVCAVRTGCGKSQTSRYIIDYYRSKGFKIVAIRHPMPYGNLVKSAVQRFETYKDLDFYDCTIEEREEYEPYIDRGVVVYAGVDYEKILKQAEKEAEIIVWDGGNNDLPFINPDLHVVVVDPHRPDHELLFYPGEANFRMADVIIINKIDTAPLEGIKTVENNIKRINPKAKVIKAASPLTLSDKTLIKGRNVLVVEDGPTLTHGNMKYGAGIIATQKFHAKSIVDPRKYAVGSIKETFKKYPHLTNVLPAMGYGKKQMKDLEKTISRVKCEVIIDGSPVNLKKVIKVKKPIVEVDYELKVVSGSFDDILKKVKVRKK